MQEAPKQNRVKHTLRWLAPALALVATLPVALGGSSASAEANEAGMIDVATVNSLAPGEVYEINWTQADKMVAHYLDVLPVPSALDLGAKCIIEPVRMYKIGVQKLWDTPPELTVYTKIQNIGSVTCGAKVRLGWVRQ